MGVWIRGDYGLIYAHEIHINKIKDSGYSIASEGNLIQSYSTKEKCLEVLDKIQDFIKTRVNNDLIFIVPKEEIDIVEHKEPIKLTRLEYELLVYCKKQDFKWIARNYNSLLFVYVKEPHVEGTRFESNRSDDRIPFELSYDDLFSFVEWGKNEEPIFIQDILDNCKIIEGDKEEF